MPEIPNDPPPSYEQATGSQAQPSSRPSATATASQNSIPSPSRRSMEDTLRPLPEGWVRTFDPETHHQFYVDTRADPPRSIWHHPFDDDQYLASLDVSERQAIRTSHHTPQYADLAADSTDEEIHSDSNNMPGRPRPAKRKLGRKVKDKLTGTTHEQRVAERRRREKEEQEAYQLHMTFRRALAEATRTGRPQLLGKDKEGLDLWLEGPNARFAGVRRIKRLSPEVCEVEYHEGRRPAGPGRYLRPDGDVWPGMGYGPGQRGGYPMGGMAGPFTRPGMAGPFTRPGTAYRRPVGYGYGYGGGMGMPLFAPLMGGVMLGSLAGSMF